MKITNKFGSVWNAAKYQNTSPTWRGMLKQITFKVYNLIVGFVQKFSNQGEVWETMWVIFIKRKTFRSFNRFVFKLCLCFSCFWANKDLHGICIWRGRQKSYSLQNLRPQVEVCDEYPEPYRRKTHGWAGLQVPLLWILCQHLANRAAAHETHP